MSWIDEARERQAEAERKRNAEKAEGAKQVAKAAAKVAAAAEAERTKALYRFEAECKRLLPRGVEIVEVFIRNEPEVLHDKPTVRHELHEKPAVRVDLGNSVQFDLVFDLSFPNPPTTRIVLEACEVEGSTLSEICTFSSNSASPKTFSKTDMEDLLFNALEKHDAMRGNG